MLLGMIADKSPIGAVEYDVHEFMPACADCYFELW